MGPGEQHNQDCMVEENMIGISVQDIFLKGIHFEKELPRNYEDSDMIPQAKHNMPLADTRSCQMS